MAIGIRWYSAKRIAQYGRSRAVDAMVVDFGVIKLWHCEIAVQKLAFKRHKMDLLLSSSKRQAIERLNTRIKLKSSANFLAIKR